MSYKIDNVKNHQNGWLCGQFLDDPTLKTSDFEVNYSTFEPGYAASKHSHPKSKMLLLVLSGKIKFKFEDEERVLESQDFVFLDAGVAEEVVEVIEKTTMLCVRAPSVVDNKLELS